jgi:hypothetical protein
MLAAPVGAKPAEGDFLGDVPASAAPEEPSSQSSNGDDAAAAGRSLTAAETGAAAGGASNVGVEFATAAATEAEATAVEARATSAACDRFTPFEASPVTRPPTLSSAGPPLSLTPLRALP